MKRCLQIFGVLALLAIPLGSVWLVDGDQLQAVVIERPNGERFRTEDPDFLRQVELWYHGIEGPSLRQRLLRCTGRWTAPGLRQPDYEVTLLFKNGRKTECAVWVYAKDYVPVYTARWSGTSGGSGYSCLARSEPFTAMR